MTFTDATYSGSRTVQQLRAARPEERHFFLVAARTCESLLTLMEGYVRRMKWFACAVLLGGLFGSGCTSETGNNAAPPSDADRGTPEAYCPALVDVSVEGAKAAAAVSATAGPDVVNGPEFARTRELLGELIAVAPPEVEAKARQGQEPITAIVALVPSCVGDQTAQCKDRVSELRQETNAAAFTGARIASVTEACSAPSYLAGTAECDTLALALLEGEGAGEALLQHFDDRCD